MVVVYILFYVGNSNCVRSADHVKDGRICNDEIKNNAKIYKLNDIGKDTNDGIYLPALSLQLWGNMSLWKKSQNTVPFKRIKLRKMTSELLNDEFRHKKASRPWYSIRRYFRQGNGGRNV